MPRINILTVRNGFGLQRDTELLAEILGQAGFEVTFTPIAPLASQMHPLLNQVRHSSNSKLRWCCKPRSSSSRR